MNICNLTCLYFGIEMPPSWPRDFLFTTYVHSWSTRKVMLVTFPGRIDRSLWIPTSQAVSWWAGNYTIYHQYVGISKQYIYKNLYIHLASMPFHTLTFMPVTQRPDIQNMTSGNFSALIAGTKYLINSWWHPRSNSNLTKLLVHFCINNCWIASGTPNKYKSGLKIKQWLSLYFWWYN